MNYNLNQAMVKALFQTAESMYKLYQLADNEAEATELYKKYAALHDMATEMNMNRMTDEQYHG